MSWKILCFVGADLDGKCFDGLKERHFMACELEGKYFDGC